LDTSDRVKNWVPLISLSGASITFFTSWRVLGRFDLDKWIRCFKRVVPQAHSCPIGCFAPPWPRQRGSSPRRAWRNSTKRTPRRDGHANHLYMNHLVDRDRSLRLRLVSVPRPVLPGPCARTSGRIRMECRRFDDAQNLTRGGSQ
jgi:hypothetical protein